MKPARARTDITQIEEDLSAAVQMFRPLCQRVDETAWATIETFLAISLRVMKKTNPSKIRDAARTEEIAARLHGREVIEDE